MASQGSAWYVDFFRADYLNVYGHMFTDERAEKESSFLTSALDLEPGAQVLDLCCGQGRHSVQLAKRGFKVTGLDLNPEYVQLAQQAALASGVSIETVTADMREVPFQNKFDAIVNMYSSFGYLESETEDLKVLQSVAKALKVRRFAPARYAQPRVGDRQLHPERLAHRDRRNPLRRTARFGSSHQPHARSFHRGRSQRWSPRIDRPQHPALHAHRDEATVGKSWLPGDGGIRRIRARGLFHRNPAHDYCRQRGPDRPKILENAWFFGPSQS